MPLIVVLVIDENGELSESFNVQLEKIWEIKVLSL